MLVQMLMLLAGISTAMNYTATPLLLLVLPLLLLLLQLRPGAGALTVLLLEPRLVKHYK